MQASMNNAIIIALDIFKKINGFVKHCEANQACKYEYYGHHHDSVCLKLFRHQFIMYNEIHPLAFAIHHL